MARRVNCDEPATTKVTTPFHLTHLAPTAQDADAARFYFADLAKLNDSEVAEVSEVAECAAGAGASPMAECSGVVMLKGTQRAKMQGQARARLCAAA